jgi:hypothetical protein
MVWRVLYPWLARVPALRGHRLIYARGGEADDGRGTVS